MNRFLHPGLAAISLIFGANEFVPRSGLVALPRGQRPRSVRVFENSLVAQPGLSIVARDVFDPAVANGYHVTILQRALLDPATVHEGTVCTPEINKADTV